jgi:hypothetical protein
MTTRAAWPVIQSPFLKRKPKKIGHSPPSIQLRHRRRTVSAAIASGRVRISALWHRGRGGSLRDQLPADSLNGAFLRSRKPAGRRRRSLKARPSAAAPSAPRRRNRRQGRRAYRLPDLRKAPLELFSRGFRSARLRRTGAAADVANVGAEHDVEASPPRHQPDPPSTATLPSINAVMCQGAQRASRTTAKSPS